MLLPVLGNETSSEHEFAFVFRLLSNALVWLVNLDDKLFWDVGCARMEQPIPHDADDDEFDRAIKPATTHRHVRCLPPRFGRARHSCFAVPWISMCMQ